jgi:hypothetical protein
VASNIVVDSREFIPISTSRVPTRIHERKAVGA